MKILTEYKSKLYHFIVRWDLPSVGQQKCNTDGTNRGNPGPSIYAFCIRDHNGNLCYAQARQRGQMSNIQAEAKAILEAVRYWEKEE